MRHWFSKQMQKGAWERLNKRWSEKIGEGLESETPYEHALRESLSRPGELPLPINSLSEGMFH